MITEYAKYQSAGGTLTETQYNAHLNNVKTFVGDLINKDPKDHTSDIGKRIFDGLKGDLNSALAFTRVSRGLNTRSKECWFTMSGRDIIFKHIQRQVSYLDYQKDGGWKDFVIIGAKVAGVALTIASSIKTIIHTNRIPPDAPKKTITITDEDGIKHEITYIDHPEARKADAWKAGAIAAGFVTGTAIVADGIRGLLKNLDLDIFLCATAAEKEILGYVKTNFALRVFSPDYHEWKLIKFKENLAWNPPDWRNHPQLKTMKLCSISADFRLYPVEGKCGHRFDFRAVRAYQLNPATKEPLECPVCTTKPNKGLLYVRFDMAQFCLIQKILHS